jgi:hypothetical protein
MNQQDQQDQESQFSYAARSIIKAQFVMECVNDAKWFFPYCGSGSPYSYFARNDPLDCVYLRFAYHLTVKTFPVRPINFNYLIKPLITKRVKSGLLSLFLQRGDTSRISAGNTNNTVALRFASDFCIHNPPEMYCFWDRGFDYSRFLLLKEIQRKSFEIAFNGYLVPFYQGETSLTLTRFWQILRIILNYMQNLQNDFEETIRSETTVGGVGDCPVSDYRFDCGLMKSPERMLNLHYSQEGLSIVNRFISELSQLM